MTRVKYLFILSCFCLAFAPPQKEERLFLRALADYREGNLLQAEKQILAYLKHDSLNGKGYLLLHDISAELGKETQQKKALQQAIRVDPAIDPLSLKMLADLFYKEQNYDEASKFYEQYLLRAEGSDTLLVALRLASCRFVLESLGNPSAEEPERLDSLINTAADEYWPMVAADDRKLFFTRLRGKGPQALEEIFLSEYVDGKWMAPEKLNLPVQDQTNAGAMSFSADGQWLFYTACGEPDGAGSCDLYFSMKGDEAWSVPKNIGSPVNTAYWEAQPSVSADKKWLYFASNRPGGKGNMDLWKSRINIRSDGFPVFSEPENLGNPINTPGNDFSPFIHADGQNLYFASDGQIGMGGSDVIRALFTDSGTVALFNPGFPLNSPWDEYGLTVSPTARWAFYSSDRDTSRGSSKDLYRMALPPAFLPKPAGFLTGYVMDSISGRTLRARIGITCLENRKTNYVEASEKDGYRATVLLGKTYSLSVNEKGYLFYSRPFEQADRSEFQPVDTLNIFLLPVKAGESFVLNNVFFDFDSYMLRPESYPELERLVQFLKENPGVSIEISGHTDNMGVREYNQELSTQRARTIAEYLQNELSGKRFLYAGYGPDRPVADNSTEEGRALNRRTEINIVSVE